MQLVNRIKYCNGCGACIVGCKYSCIKMHERDEEVIQELIKNAEKPQSADGDKRVPLIDENGCCKCNGCTLYCPVYNPIDMPEFDEWYELDPAYEKRDMPHEYRQTLRQAKTGNHTEFVGTLCQIAGLISLMGNRIRPNVVLKPMICDAEKRDSCEGCRNCIYY